MISSTLDLHLSADLNHPSLFECLTLSTVPLQPILADTSKLSLPQTQSLCPKALHAVVSLIILFEHQHDTQLLYHKIQSHPKLKKISHIPLSLQSQKQIRKTGSTLLKEIMPNNHCDAIKQFLDTNNTQTAKATVLLEMCTAITFKFLAKVIEYLGINAHQFSMWLKSQPQLDHEPNNDLNNEAFTVIQTYQKGNYDDICTSSSLATFDRNLMIQKIKATWRQPFSPLHTFTFNHIQNANHFLLHPLLASQPHINRPAVTQTSTAKKVEQPYASDKKTLQAISCGCYKLLKDNPLWLLSFSQNQEKNLSSRLPFSESSLVQKSGKSQATRCINAVYFKSKAAKPAKSTITQSTATNDFDIIYDDKNNILFKKPMAFWLTIISVILCLGLFGLIYNSQSQEPELPALPDIKDLPDDTPNTSIKDVAIIRVDDSE